jgi:aspartyl-tRNA(Asn)/glutamyl-tRNA(Gln) amidotransferase subunit B
MRTKEDAHDYRYFPDPDVPPLVFSEEELAAIKSDIPEMPEVKLRRYTEDYKLSPADAQNIINNKPLCDLFEHAAAAYNNPKTVAAYLLTELMYRINSGEGRLEALPFAPEDFARLVEITETSKINRANLKDILREMLASGKKPDMICDERTLWIKEDAELTNATIAKIIADNPKTVRQYKDGETKVFGFLMGQCNKALKGSAAAKTIKEILEKMLSE